MAKQEATTQGKQPLKELWEIYNVGDFIDAKDNQGDWRVGYIIQKNLNTKFFKVRFDGWASKYDEIYRFTSPKLAHFRSVVIGYTGQKKNPGIRSDWKFSLKQHLKKTSELKEYLQNPKKSAWEVNQFLRGHNYLYADFLMTQNYQTIEIMGAVMQYFMLNVQLVIEHISKIDAQFEKYYRSQQNEEESLIYDSQSAVVNSFFEVMDTLYVISGSYARFDSFFSKNAAQLRGYLNIDFDKNVRRYYQLKILEEVMKNHGIQILENLIQKKLKNSKTLIPFLFLKSLSSLYIGLSFQIQYNQKKKIIDQLVQITKINLAKLDDKYLKDINKSHVVDLLQTLKGAYENTQDEQKIRMWVLEEEIQFYDKMVLSPYFDKKLKGVIGFQELAERNRMQPFASQFIQILKKKNIFDSLFANDNAEIIRKAVEFCKALNINQMFPQQIAFRIWKLRDGKHQAALKQIYGLISSLPSKRDQIQFEIELFQEISKQPKQLWDEDYIKMIKQYSLSAIGWGSSQDTNPQTFGLEILLQNALIKKTQFAISSFIQVLSRFEKTSVMQKFINFFCLVRIQDQNDDTSIYVTLLLKAVEQRITEGKQVSPAAPEVVIKDLIANSGDSEQKNAKRFELLNFVSESTETFIVLDQFMRLWNEFKGKPSQKVFYDWIFLKKDGEKNQINQKISTEIRKDIFEKIWNEQYNYSEISQKETQLLIQFFKATNQKSIRKVQQIIKIDKLELLGFDVIWHAFETAKNQKIAVKLGQFIVQLYMCPIKALENKREEWTQQLIRKFSNKIMEANQVNNIEVIKRLLIIPIKIIERDSQIFTPTRFPKSYYMKDYKVINKATKEQKIIRFNLVGIVYEFKKLVCDKFKVPFKKCKITYKDQSIKYQNYFSTLQECSFSNAPFYLQVIEDEVPSVIQFLNSELQIFFELLGNHDLQRNVWDIVERLPIAEDELKKLQSSQKPWEEVNNPSLYKELYILRVMSFMKKEWWRKFCFGPGFLHLSTKFHRITCKAKVQRQYLKVLCQNIEKCLQIDVERKGVDLEDLVLSILKAIQSLLDNSAAQASQGKKNSVQVSIITSCFNIFHKLPKNINFLEILIKKFANSENLLSKGLIIVKNDNLRKQFMTRLKQQNHLLSSGFSQPYLLLIYQKLFHIASTWPCESQTSQYFQYAAELVDVISNEQLCQYLKQTQYQIIKTIERGLLIQKGESTSESINYIFVGYLLLMRKLIPFCRSESKEKMIEFLLYNCFFPHLRNQRSDLMCKTKQSKNAAFELFIPLFINYYPESAKALKTLSYLHNNALWRTRKIEDWTLTPGEKIKSTSGYVGLKNLGCICYMNSFFQQIFMIPNFRKALLQCEDPLSDRQLPQQNVLFQVKKMFYSLLHSDSKYYIPNQFCHAFKNYEGQPTNVFEQMDIDQFSNILFDRLENQIKGTPHQNIIKDFFGGVYSNQIICKGCPHFSQSQQSFLSISLNVKGKKNIYQSFDTMIKGDTLDGDNAYFCERCNKKVHAVKRVCLKKLPDHVILTLKRFQFDFQTMSKNKLNDYCQFPTELNLKEYSQQHLRKLQNPDRFEDDQVLPDQYYDYTLQGVVIHIGHADSGHYFSYIKQRKQDGNWFQFNDTIVRPFDITKLAEEAFGGQMGTIQVKQKIKNAYMLIYERKKKAIDHSKLINNNLVLEQLPIYKSLQQHIQEQNVIQKIQNILFSTEYSKFAGNVLKNIQKMESQIGVQALKFVVRVYLTVIIRQKSELSSFEFLKNLQGVLDNYQDVKEWIIEIFSAQKTLVEIFRNNPAKEVKRLLAYWISSIAKSVQRQKRQVLIDALIAFIGINGENFPEFCQILFELMDDKQTVVYVSSRKIVGILVENILGKEKEKSVFKKNLQYLKIVEDAQNLIGKQIIIQKSQHELNKKIKFLQETPYVWGVISRVLELAQKDEKDINEFLTKQEIDLLHLPIFKIYKILEQLKGKFMIKKFCRVLTFLGRKNWKFSQEVMNLGINGMKQFESKRYRQFFIMLNSFARIEDELKEKRNIKALDIMVKSLKENEKYTLDSNIIQQWILKSVRKSKEMQSILAQKDELLKYLKQFTTKKYPSEDVWRKNVIFQQTSVNKYHGIKMLRSKKSYEALGKKMQKFYADLEDEKQVQELGWESDDDLTQSTIQVGDKIAYFDIKDKVEFIEGRVQEKLFARLSITVNKSKMPPIWQDDERLTSGNYPFADSEEQDEIVDSQNTTQMQYQQDLNANI